MGRPVVLSNGQLFVGLDETGLVHDFYYPYVGLENLTNARSSQHKIGIYVDKKFSWIDDGSWEVKVMFEERALISDIMVTSKSLKISIHLQDYIDSEYNAFIRHITVTNDSLTERDIKLFMHQVFQISQSGRADTAMYVPEEHYLLDYKGRFCLLVAGKSVDGDDFDQYAVGAYDIDKRIGTFFDAQDGELSYNPVEHGSVDSVVRFSKTLKSKQSSTIDYWIIAGKNQIDIQNIHVVFKKQPMEERLTRVRQNWQQWLERGNYKLPDLYIKSLNQSLLIIKAHCDQRGSVLASGDSSIFNYSKDYYCYCWPRDAAYAIWPLIRLGHFDEAKRFFEFAQDTVHKDGYLMHKYQPDRAIGSTWHPLIHGKNRELAIQEDETAGVVFMLGEYYTASNDSIFIENIFHTFIVPAANFMCNYIDEETGLPHASYDLWEEKFLTSTYSVCTVIAGLEAASKLATLVESPADALKWKQTAESIRSNLDKLLHKDGYFIKGFLMDSVTKELVYDDTLDISNLYGPYMYAGLALGDPRLIRTGEEVEKRLLDSGPIGGVIRYENDNYLLDKKKFKGNPWIVCTLWLAQYFTSINEASKAKKLLDWAISREMPSGVLSEQFDPENGNPLGVAPLVWSHAEVVNTILDVNSLN